MDNFQKIEQIVNKAGCSYEEAKTALEACGWDMIDAIISLERDGKINKETVEQTAPKAEQSIEIVPEVKSGKTEESSEEAKADADEGAKESP